jgi:asparagine synthase (glutamine-hydrolysing)
MAGFYPRLAHIRLTKTAPTGISKSNGEIEWIAREQIMSVQFGRWNFEGQPPAPDYIEKVGATLAPYGSDSNESYSKGGINILYRAFHTTKESHLEKQPCISLSGAIITWDGRLDNRADLISELSDSLTNSSTDVAIVAVAYEKWRTNCLGKLIGDWALSIWNPRERSVLLAKDPIGTKHLYYSFDEKQLTWSTILDPLVLFAGKTFMMSEEYIACWLTNQFPTTHLTPYVGIQAVPPSCAVLLRPGKHAARHTITKYWDFDPNKRVRYRTDAEYEEHFRFAFATAVQRRLRSDRPVLAELSGGMDSSSIVCMADLLMGVGAQGSTRYLQFATSPVECPRVDTISWFGDFYAHLDPATNAVQWISKVEEKRGRTGFHINLTELRELRSKQIRSQTPFMSAFDSSGFACTPAPRNLSRFFKLYAEHMASQGHRVIISGIGGDRVTGSEPTPMPELQNLLARGRVVMLARQLSAWAIKVRNNRMPLLWEAVREFFPRRSVANDISTAPWFRSDYIHRNSGTLCNRPARVKFLTRLPSSQYNLDGLDHERRIAAYWDFNPDFIREVRYPFLDKDFLGFMYAIPREQVVKIGQHRFLMKNALVGIVPDEVLNRNQKTFLLPASEKETENNRLAEALRSVDIGQHMVSSSMGFIDPGRFSVALQTVTTKQDTIMRMLTLTLKLESWLRHLASHGVLAAPKRTDEQVSYLSLRAKDIPLSTHHKRSAS